MLTFTCSFGRTRKQLKIWRDIYLRLYQFYIMFITSNEFLKNNNNNKRVRMKKEISKSSISETWTYIVHVYDCARYRHYQVTEIDCGLISLFLNAVSFFLKFKYVMFLSSEVKAKTSIVLTIQSKRRVSSSEFVCQWANC